MKWVIRAGGALAIVVLLWILRAPLLSGVAEIWVVRDKVEAADAVAILNGGARERVLEAVRLYREHHVPKVILIDLELKRTDLLGVTTPQTKKMHSFLVKNGVPPEAIVTIGKNVSNSQEELFALRKWVKQNNVRTLIIPAEVFHTRRIDWFFRKGLKEDKTDVRVDALNPGYSVDNWWKSEAGLMDFQNETVRFVYAWVRS